MRFDTANRAYQSLLRDPEPLSLCNVRRERHRGSTWIDPPSLPALVGSTISARWTLAPRTSRRSRTSRRLSSPTPFSSRGRCFSSRRSSGTTSNLSRRPSRSTSGFDCCRGVGLQSPHAIIFLGAVCDAKEALLKETTPSTPNMIRSLSLIQPLFYYLLFLWPKNKAKPL